jgi:hypothetical protein
MVWRIISMQRILDKKLNELNKYKGLLVSRSEESKTELVEQIRGVMEDLELILQDLEYIEEPEEKVDLNNYRIVRSYREAKEFID